VISSLMIMLRFAEWVFVPRSNQSQIHVCTYFALICRSCSYLGVVTTLAMTKNPVPPKLGSKIPRAQHDESLQKLMTTAPRALQNQKLMTTDGITTASNILSTNATNLP
jgi:hypothetical protein